MNNTPAVQVQSSFHMLCTLWQKRSEADLEAFTQDPLDSPNRGVITCIDPVKEILGGYLPGQSLNLTKSQADLIPFAIDHTGCYVASVSSVHEPESLELCTDSKQEVLRLLGPELCAAWHLLDQPACLLVDAQDIQAACRLAALTHDERFIASMDRLNALAVEMDEAMSRQQSAPLAEMYMGPRLKTLGLPLYVRPVHGGRWQAGFFVPAAGFVTRHSHSRHWLIAHTLDDFCGFVVNPNTASSAVRRQFAGQLKTCLHLSKNINAQTLSHLHSSWAAGLDDRWLSGRFSDLAQLLIAHEMPVDALKGSHTDLFENKTIRQWLDWTALEETGWMLHQRRDFLSRFFQLLQSKRGAMSAAQAKALLLEALPLFA